MKREKEKAVEKLSTILTALMKETPATKDNHDKWREAFYALGIIEGKLEMIS